MEDVLYLTAGVAFSQAGLSSTRKENSYDYILLTEYTAADSEVEILYTLFKASVPENKVATWEFILSIDYNLDEQIADVVEKLLHTAAIEATSSKQAEIRELLSEPPVAEDEDSMNTESISEEETSNKALAMIFDSSVSAAAVILLGEITEYFHYGVSGLLTTGVTWPLEFLSINLDTKLSFIRVFNNVGVVGGTLYFSTAGLNLQIGTATNNSYHSAMGFSGGAALITVATEEEIMTKTVPYADAGVHTSIFLGDNFFLGGDIFFLMIFDDDILIMGVCPSLTLGFMV